MSRPVLIAAGGTGGHMFPALALARELQGRGRAVALVVDARGARYLEPDLEAHVIRAASPSGSPLRRLAGSAQLALGLAQALALVARLRPLALAGFGGYASVPAALAARLARLPLLVHEQNAVLGRANRLIARGAGRIALSFEDTRGAEALPPARRVVTGNPVRPGFHGAAIPPYRAPAPDEPLRLLVLGGSQGARVLSEVLPQALAALPEALRARLELVQQCRPEDLEGARAAYAAAAIRAELARFFDDVPQRLARAHLVVSRAGASTVAELLACGRPALLVPYKHAADDHQRANAALLAAAGCAALVPEDGFTPQAAADRLAGLLGAPERLALMAERARGLATPDAALRIADALDALLAPRPSARAGAGRVL